jgi:acyl dehydratase/CBS domain-containing protein
MPIPIQVQDLMSSPVRTVSADSTITEAAAMCNEFDINSLVVIEDDVVGIVTGTDLLRALGTEDDTGALPVRDVMSAPVRSFAPDQSVTAAMSEMREYDIARLVVLDGAELVGLLSTDDIVRHVPQVFHRAGLPPSADRETKTHAREETAYENPDWTFESTTISEGSVTVGDTVEFGKRITEQDVRTFAAASGDTNRLHLDAAYASETRFGRRIVHGTLVGGLISAALARIPGMTIYLSQDLSFLAPVDIGSRVTARCEIVDTLGANKYELTTDVHDEAGEKVIEGEAAVLVDELPEMARVTVEPSQ